MDKAKVLKIIYVSYNPYFYRCSLWWDYIVLQTFQEHDWKKNFRIIKPTFMYLCNTMLQHQDTVFRKAISVEKRVAVTLWCLATCAEYRTIGNLFGIARCTVCVIVHQTVDAIATTLLRSYIKFPTGPNLENTVADFEKKLHFPCAGAM